MKSLTLPNGRIIQCVSRRDARLIYRDVFTSDCYRRGGIKTSSGDVVVDVGANVGLFEVFLDSVAPGCKVFAFEPVPDLVQCLRANAATCKRLDVTVVEAAVVGEGTPRRLTYYPRFPSASTMHPSLADRDRDHAYVRKQMPWWLPKPAWLVEAVRRWHLKPQVVRCGAWTLPDFMRAWEVGRIDLLKIDAEGAEWGIVESMRLAGLWERVRQVVVEVHDDEPVKMELTLAVHGFRTTVLPNPEIPELSIVYGVRA